MKSRESLIRGIGELIRERRKEMHLTQSELAKRCGLKSNSAISRLETGVLDHALSVEIIGEIFSSLELPEEYTFALKMAMGVNVPAWESVELLCRKAVDTCNELKYEEALTYVDFVNTALNIYNPQQAWNTNSHRLAVDTFDVFGRIYRVKNFSRVACDIYKQALEHAEALEDTVLIAKCHTELAVTYRMTEQFSYAERELRVARKLLENLKTVSAKKLYAEIDINLLATYTKQHKYSETQTFFNSALQIAKSCSYNRQDTAWSEWVQQSAHRHYALALFDQESLQDAQDYASYSKCITDTLSPEQNRLNQVSADIILYQIKLQEKRFDEADFYREEVLQICKQYGFHHQKAKLHKLVSLKQT